MKKMTILPAVALAIALSAPASVSAATMKSMHGFKDIVSSSPAMPVKFGPVAWKSAPQFNGPSRGHGHLVQALLKKKKYYGGWNHGGWHHGGGKPPQNGGGAAPIPVPAALPLLAAGLGVMGLVARRRRQTETAA